MVRCPLSIQRAVATARWMDGDRPTTSADKLDGSWLSD